MRVTMKDAVAIIEEFRNRPHLMGNIVIRVAGTDQQAECLAIFREIREAMVHDGHRNELDAMIEALKIGIEEREPAENCV